MKIVICDDDPSIRNHMRTLINGFFKAKKGIMPELYEFSSAEEMLSKPQHYDLAFLDVEMQGISGIVAGKKLVSWNRDILIFIVTGFAHTYLDEALEQGIYRYITKPVESYRLYNNLEQALIRLSNIHHKVNVEADSGTYTIDTHNILVIKTEKRKVIVQTTDKEYITSTKMSFWKNTLPDLMFMETFKGVIVNFQHVLSFHDDIIQLDVPNVTAYISKRHFNEFKKRYALYIESEG